MPSHSLSFAEPLEFVRSGTDFTDFRADPAQTPGSGDESPAIFPFGYGFRRSAIPRPVPGYACAEAGQARHARNHRADAETRAPERDEARFVGEPGDAGNPFAGRVMMRRDTHRTRWFAVWRGGKADRHVFCR